MTWFKVDDGFWSHPKVAALSDSAIALWVRAGSYSSQHLTDGFIARSVLRMVGESSAVVELLDAGLWMEAEGGYQFHDWAEYQETSAAVKLRREQARERQRRSREAREAKRARPSKGSASVTRDSNGTDAEGHDAFGEQDSTAGPVETAPEENAQVGDSQPSNVTHAVTRDNTREFSTPDPTVGRVGTTSRPSLPLSPNGDREVPRKRGTRLPENWMPRQDTIDWAKANHPNVNLRAEHEKFMNHWPAQPGQKGVKLDWDRTWRNWIIRAGEHSASRLPAASGMSRREQKIAAAERFKTNPNPELMRRAGFDTRPGLTALPGGMQ